MSSSILFPTNQYTTSSKSSEQIQRLMMNQQSLLDRLLYILNKGHPLQQPYAFRNFHHYPNQLLQIICSNLSKQDADNQAIITESLKIIMKKQKHDQKNLQNYSPKLHYKKSSPKNSPFQGHKTQRNRQKTLEINSEHLDLIFNTVLDTLSNWSSLNNQHLIQVIETVIQVKPKVQVSSKQNLKTYDKTRQQYLKTLQQTILNMGKQSQPIISKIVSGRLIPIFVKYTGHVIRGEMIDIIKRIISDNEFEAKKIWLEEILPKMLQNLKLQYIELHLQQKIYETIYDENQQIGCMALNIVLKNVSKFSVEQQGSRIVKLFIDSLTSKNQKVTLIVTQLMGQIYQKLQGIILKSQTHCIRFWKSLIEVAESKNQKILKNFIYNLPGILLLSKKFYKVDAVCLVYTQLFYNPEADTHLLVSYFHQMVKMFPNKKKLLRETIYALLDEIFQEKQVSEQSMKIMDSIFRNLNQSKTAFFQQTDDTMTKSQFIELQRNDLSNQQPILSYFDSTINQHIQKYFQICLNRKNGNYLLSFFQSMTKCYECFSSSFIEVCLLPKLYQAIRSKTPYSQFCMKLIVRFLSRQISSINNYVSKINVELSKSSKSYERQSALVFLYYSFLEFSVETFQQYKMGEKFLQFSNDKNLKNKLIFLKYCPQIMYYLTRQQKIELGIILNKLKKQHKNQNNEYSSVYEISLLLDSLDYSENEATKAQVMKRSKKIREKQKSKGNLTNSNPNQLNFMNSKKLFGSRKGPTDINLKDLKKEDVLKRRVQTKSKTKIMIKDVTKKRTPAIGIRTSLPKKN